MDPCRSSDRREALFDSYVTELGEDDDINQLTAVFEILYINQVTVN